MLMNAGVLDAPPVQVKQKVAFVIDALKVGGAEKFLLTLLNSLANQQYDLSLILLNQDNPLLHELDERVSVQVFERKFKFDFRVSGKINTYLKQEDIRQVFCVDLFPFFMARWRFLFDRDITVYLSLHHTLPTSFKYLLLNYTYLRFLAKQDRIIYICHYQKAYFQKTYHLGKQRSYVIYNGIDTNYFSPEAIQYPTSQEALQWREKVGIKKEEQVILKVASLRIEKRHDHAVQALGLLHASHNIKAHLVFVGTKPSDKIYIEMLSALAQSLGVASFVHFIPMQPDVRPYLATADIFTLTSHTETFSLSALEAMSMGLPCSLTEIGGAAEMIEPGKTGELSQPDNPESIAASWKKLLTCEYDKEYIRERVREKFSAEKMIRQYGLLFS